MVSFSMMFSGMLMMGVSGPSVLVISFRFLVSVWSIAPMSGAVIMYEAR